MTNLKSGLVQLHWSALSDELGSLRSRVDQLGAEFNGKYGPAEELVQRTEALSASIQRLEWAIARYQLRSMAAGSGS